MNSYQQWQIVVKFNIPLFYRYFYNHLSNYTKTIVRLRPVNIGEYSPRLRLGEYLTVILRGRAGYELIYITNEAVGRVGYYQLISGKSEKNNCFSKFSSNSLDFFV